MTWVHELVACALAAYAVGWLLSEDDLTAPARARLFRRVFTRTPDGPVRRKGRRWSFWLYTGLSCPACTSTHAGFAALYMWRSWGDIGRLLVTIAAVRGLALAFVRAGS